MSQKSATEVCITTDFGPAVKNYKLQWIFIYYICDYTISVTKWFWWTFVHTSRIPDKYIGLIAWHR